MTREDALETLRLSSWRYIPRISKMRPYPVAIPNSPGVNEEVLRCSGLNLSGKDNGIAELATLKLHEATPNGEGITRKVKPKETNPGVAVFGRENIAYLVDHGVNLEMEHRLFRFDLPPGNSGIGV